MHLSELVDNIFGIAMCPVSQKQLHGAQHEVVGLVRVCGKGGDLVERVAHQVHDVAEARSQKAAFLERAVRVTMPHRPVTSSVDPALNTCVEAQ